MQIDYTVKARINSRGGWYAIAHSHPDGRLLSVTGDCRTPEDARRSMSVVMGVRGDNEYVLIPSDPDEIELELRASERERLG